MPDNEKQEFAAMLVQHGKGLVHDQASELLRKATAAVKDLGKPAEINIKVKITPVKNNTRVVQVDAKATAKIPEPITPPAIFFADDDGGLHRNDPTQRELWDDASDSKTAAAGRD